VTADYGATPPFIGNGDGNRANRLGSSIGGMAGGRAVRTADDFPPKAEAVAPAVGFSLDSPTRGGTVSPYARVRQDKEARGKQHDRPGERA
jgi:hypothetical protein